MSSINDLHSHWTVNEPHHYKINILESNQTEGIITIKTKHMKCH